jgi:signal transduction histidine kinase
MIALERAATLQWVGAGLMHSLGKPLSIAARSAERLLSTRCGDAEVRRLAEVVRCAADEALNGIDTIRGQGEEASPASRAEIALEEIISRAMARVRQLHEGRRVVARLGADLPRVRFAHDLRRVLTSLLDNALLASGPDDPSPEIAVFTKPGLLAIEVIDFGSGMSRATLEKATDAFFTTRKDAGGSGIGLFDARFTMERLGGQLVVRSEVGRGTIVSVQLPLSLCHEARLGSPIPSSSRRAS